MSISNTIYPTVTVKSFKSQKFSLLDVGGGVEFRGNSEVRSPDSVDLLDTPGVSLNRSEVYHISALLTGYVVQFLLRLCDSPTSFY